MRHAIAVALVTMAGWFWPAIEVETYNRVLKRMAEPVDPPGARNGDFY